LQAIARHGIEKRRIAKMQAVMATIRPGDLYRRIQELTQQAERLALSKAPTPAKPRVNRAFNSLPEAEVF
jgi:hypothetical protein